MIFNEINILPITIGGKHASFWQQQNQNEDAHFYGGNGLPTLAYYVLLQCLSQQYSLKCLSLRPTWPGIGKPCTCVDWNTYADDLIQFVMQRYDKPIIGIGHGMGASATIIAASKRPELFKKLILIEPSTISITKQVLFKITPGFLKIIINQPRIKKHGQRVWQSREEFFAECRSKDAYQKIKDNVLHDFASYNLLQNRDMTFRLAFPSDWEVWNYQNTISTLKYLKKVVTPTLVICGKPSVNFTQRNRESWVKILPKSEFIVEPNYGYFIPFEAPEVCAKFT